VQTTQAGTLTNTSSVSGDELDLNGANDSATEQTTVNSPTAVTLVSFTAAAFRDTVTLRWRTAAEPQLLGFDVYRSGRKLNRRLIAARGSVSSRRPRLRAPAPSACSHRLTPTRSSANQPGRAGR
jgi:hypothetical protein